MSSRALARSVLAARWGEEEEGIIVVEHVDKAHEVSDLVPLAEPAGDVGTSEPPSGDAATFAALSSMDW